MSRIGGRGPKLPKTLLDRVQGSKVSKAQRNAQASRKDKRKADRQSKKAPRKPWKPVPQATVQQEESDGDVEDKEEAAEEEEDEHELPGTTRQITKARRPPSSRKEHTPEAAVVSKAVKAKLQDDDDEIAALEKKLGMGRKKSRKTGDEELDWLVYGSGSEEENTNKRKRPEDDAWLRDKRRRAAKTTQTPESIMNEDSDDSDSDINGEDWSDEDAEAGGVDDLSTSEMDDEFEGFNDKAVEKLDKSIPQQPAVKRQRENPYVAPVTAGYSASPAKYIPPSLRKAPTSDEEMLKQLKRQLQGLLNRLSEANLLSILQSVQDLYSNNARQYVTSTLIDLLSERICDPSVLNDTFLILHSGFSAALYRVIGTDFGAQLLESLVSAFDSHHSFQADGTDANQHSSEGKQALNVMAFLSDLYVLQAISCDVIFDYIRLLLDKHNFSEANTELLLRIIRIAGTQLRQDDPSALKDIVLLLQRTISAVGEGNVTVRTKFMVETIHNVKNNRMKTGVASSTMSAEHTQQMKKTLGSIKSAKTNEPLRITLSDIRDTEKKGKWWLVGASWRDPAKMANNQHSSGALPARDKEDEAEDSDDSDTVDLDKVAREQGMNTDVRRAIFVAITGAVDFQHAYMRVLKLNLKSKQQIEIPRVVLHCVGAEPTYNHFYTLVATKFCSDHKLRKAYEFALLDMFRRMGETEDDVDTSEIEEEDDLDVNKIYKVAKFYATMIAEGLLRLSVLKTLDFANLQAKTDLFASILLATLFILLRKKASAKPKNERDAEYEKYVDEVYEHVHEIPGMVTGLRHYLTSVLPFSDVAANEKEQKVMESGCDFALQSLAKLRQ